MPTNDEWEDGDNENEAILNPPPVVSETPEVLVNQGQPPVPSPAAATPAAPVKPVVVVAPPAVTINPLWSTPIPKSYADCLKLQAKAEATPAISEKDGDARDRFTNALRAQLVLAQQGSPVILIDANAMHKGHSGHVKHLKRKRWEDMAQADVSVRELLAVHDSHAESNVNLAKENQALRTENEELKKKIKK